tara:strand:- start:231 stop:1448 length:1218 start_codon:yes stop_codon:yes gene_type:complete
MPLPDANNYSKRIYQLLEETDLQNLSYSQFQGVAEKLFIEPENEDEMRRLVLVQLARMAVRGDWDGFLTGGGGGGGTFTGSLADTQVAFGNTAANTIQGSASFTYDDTNKILIISAGTGSPTIQSGTADLILRNSAATAHSKITLGYHASNSDIDLETDGTGVVNIYSEGVKAYNLPNVVASVNDQVLTAQTDGSTAWSTPSAGGGNAFGKILPLIGSLGPAADQYNIAASAPWGGGDQVLQPMSSMGLAARPYAFPFVSPETGTITAVGLNITTADAGINAYVGIYSQNSDNLPETRLGYATVSLSSTGSIYSTTLTGTMTLTAGEQYWYTINADANVFNAYVTAVATSTSYESATPLGITDDLGTNNFSIKDTTTGANAAPPSTFSNDDLDGTIGRILVGLKF